MTTHYPIVFEKEDDGSVSAFVAGLPVYAQAATQPAVERAILATLTAYLDSHPAATVPPSIKVAKVRHYARRPRPAVSLVSAAALVGRTTSRRKAASSRANGRLGGRPARSPERRSR